MASDTATMRDRRKDFYYVDDLGEGAHGRAVLALHKRTNELCHPPLEAQIAQRLTDIPGVARLVGWCRYQAEEDKDIQFALTCWTYSNAGSLQSLVLRAQSPFAGFTLPGSWALRWLAQAIRTIHDLHARGVSHNDVKEDNIVLHQTARNADPDAVLIDFGLSKLRGTYPTQSSEPDPRTVLRAARADNSWIIDCIGDYQNLLRYWQYHLTGSIKEEEEQALDAIITTGLEQLEDFERTLDDLEAMCDALDEAEDPSQVDIWAQQFQSDMDEVLLNTSTGMLALAADADSLKITMPAATREQLEKIQARAPGDDEMTRIVAFSGSYRDLDKYIPSMPKDKENKPKSKIIVDCEWTEALR